MLGSVSFISRKVGVAYAFVSNGNGVMTSEASEVSYGKGGVASVPISYP